MCKIFLFGEYVGHAQIPSAYDHLWPDKENIHYYPNDQVYAQVDILNLLEFNKLHSVKAFRKKVKGIDRAITLKEFLHAQPYKLITKHEFDSFCIMKSLAR